MTPNELQEQALTQLSENSWNLPRFPGRMKQIRRSRRQQVERGGVELSNNLAKMKEKKPTR